MEFSRAFRKFCLVAFLLAPVPALAAPVSMPAEKYRPVKWEEVRYNLYANGLKVGHLILWWEEAGATYKATFSLKTSGLARFFKKQDRYAQTTGTLNQVEESTLELTPKHFHSRSLSKRKTRVIDIDYDEKGNAVKTVVTPPDNPAVRPPVSQHGKDGGLDPMTAFQVLFSAAVQNKPNDSVTIFDGRRLTRMMLSPAGQNPFKCKTCTVYSLTRQPVEGFDAGDIEDFKKGDPPMRVAIEPEASRFPYGARVDVPWGTLTAERD